MTQVAAADFIDALTWHKSHAFTGDTRYTLCFSTNGWGPTFGPLQMDLASNGYAQSAVIDVLTAAQWDPSSIKDVLVASRNISRIVTETAKEKVHYFAVDIGQGNPAAGETLLKQIILLLPQNADYIHVKSSEHADDVARQINEYFRDINFTGTPEPTVVKLLAALAHETGSLQWLKKFTSDTKAGPVTVHDLDVAAKTSAKIFNYIVWKADFDKSVSQLPGAGSWYIQEENRASYKPTGSVGDNSAEARINLAA
jgi:hypothetical protein